MNSASQSQIGFFGIWLCDALNPTLSDRLLVAPTSHAPTPTALATPATPATITPEVQAVREITVRGQPDSASIYVGALPVQITLLGEGLDTITSVVLQPKTPGQRTIPLKLLQTQGGRTDIELASLPSSFHTGEYELLINGQSNRTITLRDYVREARIQGIKAAYRYLAAIRPFPSIRFTNQDIPGPFAMLYLRPDPAARGGYMRNGDLIEVLDDTSTPDFYRVRVKENFDSNVVGREGWMLAWVVNDTPPAPPEPGAIQISYNIRGEPRERVVEWLIQRGLTANDIVIDTQTRERIPDVFDTFKPDQVVSSDPIEGAWVVPGGKVVLGVRGP